MASRQRCIKVLFDECIGAPIARAGIELLKFYDDGHKLDLQVIADYEKMGAKDKIWARKCADEGRFVITADRGKRKDGIPLDLLLPSLGISAAFMTGALHSQRKQFEKMRSIVYLWPEITKEAVTAKPGTRFKIQIQRQSFRLAEWPLTDAQRSRGRFILGEPEIPESLFSV